jgi:drug/metabolite transporter (DMT)-like permease
VRRTYLVHAALFLVATLFSANYIISKLAMASFSPLTFAYLRVVGAAILLQVVMPRDRTPLDRGDSMRLAGFAMLAVVINQTAFLTGLALTSAHVAAILITTIPVFTLAAAIALGRERATAWKVGGIALAAAGALLIVGREGFEGTRGAMIGSLLLVTNCLSYALYLVLSKPMMARQSARRVVSRMFAVGAVVMTPIAIVPLTRQDWSAIPGRAWIGLLLVIAGPTVAAYLLQAWALGHAESSAVAAYTYVQPFLATVLAAIFLGETIRPVIILAALMIFAGVYVAGGRETRRVAC